MIVSLLSLTSLPLLASSSNFYTAETFAEGTLQSGVPLHRHRMGQPAKQPSIWAGRETHKELQGRWHTSAPERKEDPVLDWGTGSLCCWRSSHSQGEGMDGPARPSQHLPDTRAALALLSWLPLKDCKGGSVWTEPCSVINIHPTVISQHS